MQQRFERRQGQRGCDAVAQILHPHAGHGRLQRVELCKAVARGAFPAREPVVRDPDARVAPEQLDAQSFAQRLCCVRRQVEHAVELVEVAAAR
nr:hypothetical protein [Ramlibacter rhizophilus]